MADIVFVCTGNICRSPMAEGILRHLWARDGILNRSVSSMGIQGLIEQPAAELARQVCEEHDIDISEHLSRPIMSDEIQDAELVLCMEPAHQQYLSTFFPWKRDSIALLGAWPEKPTRKSTIADPYGRSSRHYRMAFDTIYAHVERILPLL